MKNQDETIRVSTAKLDNLINLVGELYTGRTRLMTIQKELSEKYNDETWSSELSHVSSHIGKISSELQDVAMQVRMVSISRLFNKYPRIVRDTANQAGKEVNLIIKGEQTELDKTVIEEMNAPLVHLIRNAIDHGIEPAAERLQKSKPEKGTLEISAEHQGNNVVIKIKEDGQGLDIEGIKSQLIKKDILIPEETSNLSKNEILNYIFMPGFSTKEKTTEMSGRGVGMDVVKNTMTKLSGTIDIETEKDVGTTFILRLPLTLAIIDTVMIRTGSEIYSLQLSNVLEIVNVRQKSIKTINGREVINIRGNVIPIIRLGEILKTPDYEKESIEYFIIIVGIAEKRLGLIVDEVIGKNEIVIKPLGKYLSGTSGISGATILGSGKAILIVDIPELINKVK